MSKPRGDGGYRLPSVIDPPRRCVQVFIPDEPEHIRAFWGAVSELSKWWVWERDPLKRGTQVASVWRDVWVRATDAFYSEEGSCEVVPFDVRQNSGTPCILEKSEDGGATWVEWADLHACPPRFRVRQNTEQPCNLEFSPFLEGDAWFTFANLNLCPPMLQMVDGAGSTGQTLQFSTDGGSTWQNVGIIPLDPIGDDPPPQNPQPSDARCNASRNAMLAYYSLAWTLAAQVDVTPHPEPYLAAAEFLPVLRDRLNFFIGSNVFQNIVTNTALGLAITTYLTAIRTAAIVGGGTMGEKIRELTDYDSPFVQSAIQCAFFCAADSAGNIDWNDALEQLNELVTDTTIQASARDFIQLLGAGGMAAAASARIGTFDASACEDCNNCEWCYEWLGGKGFDPGWSFDFGSYNVGTDQIEGEETAPAPNNTNLIICTLSFPATTVTEFYVEFDFKSADTWGGNSWSIGTGVITGTNIVQAIAPPPLFAEASATLSGADLGVQTGVYIALGTPSKDGAAYTHIKRIRLRGLGDNPFGADNCDE